MNITLRNSVLSLFFASLAISFSDAQVDKKLKSRYHVTVELLDGRKVEGELLRASHESLVMIDENKIAVGCKATLRFKSKTNSPFGKTRSLFGKILEISDTSLLIAQWKTPNQMVVLFHQIDRISVESYPPMSDLKEFQQVVYKPSFIKSIRMHKKGSGALGALAGALLGFGIGYSLGESDGDWGDLRPLSGALYSLPGAAIGAVIGSSKKNYPINAKQDQFDLLVAKLYE